jgi:hypothetical protein
MERKDVTTVERTITLTGASFDDLLGAARTEVSKAQTEGWEVTFIYGSTNRVDAGVVTENELSISLEREA